MLKRLKLCGCINITGIGLNPLRGSVVLEQIDISLVRKHEKPKIKPEPQISQEVVLPILDSIVSSDGCSLTHIKFPDKWLSSEEEEEEDEGEEKEEGKEGEILLLSPHDIHIIISYIYIIISHPCAIHPNDSTTQYCYMSIH